MEIHADPTAPERYALHFQSEPLFPALFAHQRDPASGADDTMPGQSRGPLKCSDGHTRRPRKPRGFGNLPVSDHLPPRHSGDDRSESFE
jgi:hypothetical protein